MTGVTDNGIAAALRTIDFRVAELRADRSDLLRAGRALRAAQVRRNDDPPSTELAALDAELAFDKLLVRLGGQL